MSLTLNRNHLTLLNGPFTSRQAFAAGYTRWTLARAVAEGVVCRILRDVHVSTALLDDLALRCDAVRLVLPGHAVAVDRTAAWLWDVDALRPHELVDLPRLDIFVFRGHKRVTREDAGGGERDLAARDITMLDGIRVTTPLRTSLDLACRLGPYDAIAAMDAFARLHGITSQRLMRELPRFRGRRGVVQARRLAALVDGDAESSGESFTRLAMIDAGLPAPKLQHWVAVDGVDRIRLDLAYPDVKVAVEYDGEEYHSSDEQREADRRRRKWLRDHEWTVIVVTKDSFKGAALDEWIGEVRRALLDRRTTY